MSNRILKDKEPDATADSNTPSLRPSFNSDRDKRRRWMKAHPASLKWAHGRPRGRAKRVI